MNITFSELKDGAYFGCWGDQLSNYSSAIWIVAKKIDKNRAVEITITGTQGISFLVSESDTVQPYASWEDAKKMGFHIS